MVSIVIPLVIGAFWSSYFNGILVLAMVALAAAVAGGALVLPKTDGEK